MMKNLVGILLGALICAPAFAEWDAISLKEKGLPLTADGKLDVDAPVRRLPDGKPDFSGVWMVPDIQILGWNIGKDLEEGAPPSRPWAAKLVGERKERDLIDDPASRCYPTGMIGLHLISPFRIAVLEDRILVLFEQSTSFRQIFLDGRTLSEDHDPTYMGYSVGHWEGDTLVVETSGFNGKSWMDADGHPVTEKLHVTERIRRTSFGKLEAQVTFNDPLAYTKPWTIDIPYNYIVNSEVTESFCEANEYDDQLRDGGITVTDVVPQEPAADEDEATIAAQLANEDAQISARLESLLRGVPVQKTPRGWRLVLEDRMFDSSGALKPAALPNLERIGDALKQLRQVRAMTTSHSDGVSDEEIILKRSHAVRQVFIDRGAAILQGVAYSEDSKFPVASNATAAGRAKNRRVEITIGLTR